MEPRPWRLYWEAGYLFWLFSRLPWSACQDTAPIPRFVSNADDGKKPVLAPATAAIAIDTKTTASKGYGYFIEFRSRYALSYGHTYVIFGRADGSGEMINPRGRGPASALGRARCRYVLGHFVPVPAETGVSDGDLDEKYRSASWRVMLTESRIQQDRCVHSQAEGQVESLAGDGLQLQRLRGGHRQVHGLQDARHLAPAATVRHQASRDEWRVKR